MTANEVIKEALKLYDEHFDGSPQKALAVLAIATFIEDKSKEKDAIKS